MKVSSIEINGHGLVVMCSKGVDNVVAVDRVGRNRSLKLTLSVEDVGILSSHSQMKLFI